MPLVAHFRRHAAAFVAAGLFAVPAVCGAQSPDAAHKLLPTIDSLDAISSRGILLAQYDAAAWTASDSVLSRKPDPALITRYVARQIGDRWAVAFGRSNAARDTFFVAFEVQQRQADDQAYQVTEFTPARPVTDYYARAARAVAVAKEAFGPQAIPYNSAIIERPNGMFWVYLVPAQTKAGVYPLGADVRYLISSDGRLILATRQLHKSLIEFTAPAGGADQIEAGTHTAVLDDIPEDTDVFHVLVRQPRLPEIIVTDAFMWQVMTDGHIRFLGRRP